MNSKLPFWAYMLVPVDRQIDLYVCSQQAKHIMHGLKVHKVTTQHIVAS